LKAPGTKRLQLKCDELLSKFAFNLNWRRYFKAGCLLDPVDNTVYAPLGEGFPSAVAAMRAERERGEQGPQLVVVGGRFGGDCAPKARRSRLTPG